MAPGVVILDQVERVASIVALLLGALDATRLDAAAHKLVLARMRLALEVMNAGNGSIGVCSVE